MKNVRSDKERGVRRSKVFIVNMGMELLVYGMG
jgi:hypothetical protein